MNGKIWTREDDRLLLNAFDGGAKLEELASTHGRSKGSIVSQLVKLRRLCFTAGHYWRIEKTPYCNWDEVKSTNPNPPNGGPMFKRVCSFLFSDGASAHWTAIEIKAAAGAKTKLEKRAVNNAVLYLRRRGKLAIVERGLYRVIG